MDETLKKTMTDQQLQVLDFLESVETKEYPLSLWYLRAIDVAREKGKQDWIALAAHELREIAEKLLRILGREVPNWKEIVGQPKKKQFDEILKSRDPLLSSVPPSYHEQRLNTLGHLYHRLSSFAHHDPETTQESFSTCCEVFDRFLLDHVADQIADDLQKIKKLLSLPSPSGKEADQLLGLITHCGANYTYCFKNMHGAHWIDLLEAKDFFQSSQKKNMFPRNSFTAL